MVEMRLAKADEIERQKEIWKICFGDEDTYIDFYFENKYKEDETAVLLYGEEIAAMATMIPAQMVMPDGRRFSLSMLYAIATHPQYQGKGFSTQIMDFCNQYLANRNKDLSILVPAEESLFDFYSKRGYSDGFYIREVTLTRNQILDCTLDMNQEDCLIPATASEYNKKRRNQLKDRLYVDYSDEEIEYQKKLSQKFGADIYGINIRGVKGCAIIERINHSKIFIKEILMPNYLIQEGIKQISRLLPAEDYIIRLPAYLGEDLGGEIRHFGMIKLYREIETQISPEKLGYMGIAYD